MFAITFFLIFNYFFVKKKKTVYYTNYNFQEKTLKNIKF